MRNSNGTFKPGHSGNPTGKKKGTRSVPDMLKRILKEPCTDNFNKYETILRSLVDEALNGTRWAVEMVLDRTEGKPHQAAYSSTDDIPHGFIICEYTDEQLNEQRENRGEIIGGWGND